MNEPNNWIPFTEEDLKYYLPKRQLRVIREALSGPGCMDPLPQMLDDVIVQIRAEVHSSPEGKIDDDPSTIPYTLKSCACHLLVESLFASVPGMKLSSDQIRFAEKSRQRLIRVSKGELRVPEPDAWTPNYYSSPEEEEDPDDYFSMRTLSCRTPMTENLSHFGFY